MGVIITLYRGAPSLIEEIENGNLHPRALFASVHGADSQLAPAEWEDKSVPVALALDKYWHVALFLFSEEYRHKMNRPSWRSSYESPFSWTVFGAHACLYEHDEMDYPARYSLPAEVRAIADHLETLSLEDFMHPAQESSRVEMDELYWGERLSPEAPNDPRYINMLHNFQRFYRTAARKEEAVIHLRG